MTLYFCGRPVLVSGCCDDGWVWGSEPKKADAWYFMTQLHATPWGDGG